MQWDDVYLLPGLQIYTPHCLVHFCYPCMIIYSPSLLSWFPLSLYPWIHPMLVSWSALPLYLFMLPTGFPQPSWIAVVVRKEFTCGNSLQVYHYTRSSSVSKSSSEYAGVRSAARLTWCILIVILRFYVPYYDVANHLTITEMNMIDEMHWGWGILSTTVVRIRHQISHSTTQRLPLHSESSADLCKGFSYSIIWLFQKFHLIVSRMHLHYCRCFRSIMQSLWAHCLALEGRRSVWKYWAVQVQLTRVSGCFISSFWTNLHLADRGIASAQGDGEGQQMLQAVHQ